MAIDWGIGFTELKRNKPSFRKLVDTTYFNGLFRFSSVNPLDQS
ncbi:MAG: hypothetical protein U0413_03435 [Candidatus Saccharimonadales bacterium]